MNWWEVISFVLGSNILVQVITRFFDRKKEQKANDNSQLTNIDFAGETWQKVVDKLELRIDKLLTSMKELRDENLKLKDEVYQLRDELAGLKSLQRKTEKYEKKIKQLEDKITAYERLLTDNNIPYQL